MLLYFDNLITDIPLGKKGQYTELDRVRNGCEAYRMPSKLDVTKYTLASYASIPWSQVIIKYQLDDPSKKGEFESYVRSLFPKAIFIYGRSDSQKKFQDTMHIINRQKDDWIFYAGNNDHPFIAPDLDTLNACLEKASEYRKEHKYVSIVYSHFTETVDLATEGSVLRRIHGRGLEVFEEDDSLFVIRFPKGLYTSIQILHKDILNHWLFSKDLSSFVMKRIEGVSKFVSTRDQIVIIPKRELCAHFDGYTHNCIDGHCLVPSSLYPPLFIPRGFFHDDIKIAYGHYIYRKGWVNVNPLRKAYSFQDRRKGTDLKMDLFDIPLFWNRRISRIDVNPRLDEKAAKKARDAHYKAIAKVSFPKKGSAYFLRERIRIHGKNYIKDLRFLPRPLVISMHRSGLMKKAYLVVFRR